MSLENLSLGCPTRCDTNQAVQPQKMARGLKFRIQVVEGLYMYFLCSKNIDIYQLHSYCAADLYDFVFAYAKSRVSHDAACINFHWLRYGRDWS